MKHIINKFLGMIDHLSFFSFSMKKVICLLSILTMVCGCQIHPLVDKENLKIVIASDIHYFLKDYYKDCEWFEEEMLYGDGKMVTYADEILTAFIQKIKEIKPDLVLLTGDLTFNGEKGSHQTIAKKLKQLTDLGIAVAVMPGNHDIDNIFAKGYGKEDYFKVDNIDHHDFKDIYQNLGYNISYHEHDESLSYSIQLNQKYTLILMDSNSHEQTGSLFDKGGYLTPSSLSWLKDELKETQQQNRIPIVAFHHNLAIHNELLNNGYTMNNYKTIAETLKQYHVPFVLSGHIHCQHIQKIQGIYDIASSSLLDAPLQFGVMELGHQGMLYQTQSLKISRDANEYFDIVSRNKLSSEFANIKDKHMRNAMLDVVVKANRYYFTGNIYKHIDELKKMNGYQYFLDSKKTSFHRSYLEALLKEKGNHQYLKLNY